MDKEVIIFLCDFCGKMFDSLPIVSHHEQSCCLKNSVSKSCFRCGREGHYASSCSNTTHKNGYVFK